MSAFYLTRILVRCDVDGCPTTDVSDYDAGDFDPTCDDPKIGLTLARSHLFRQGWFIGIAGDVCPNHERTEAAS